MNELDGATEPNAGEGTVGEEALLGRTPALDEEIEPLMKPTVGMFVEIGGATSGAVGLSSTTLARRSQVPQR